MVSLAYPNENHYEAYLEACKSVVDYVNSDRGNDIARRETANFEFAHHSNISKEDFLKLVDTYRQSREVDFQKNPSEANPQIYFFIMDNDKIIGMIDAQAKLLKDADIKEGVKPVERWSGKYPCKADFGEMILPEYRGKGLNKEIKKQFFDALQNDYGITQVTATVLQDNDNSNRAQNKLIERYGGKSYKKEMLTPTGKIVCNSYLISTDTSGNSKHLYQSNNELSIEHLHKLRGIGPQVAHPIQKRSLDMTLVHHQQQQNINK